MKIKLVLIESPFAGDTKRNTRYARLCLEDSLYRDEAPFASHLLYPQVLTEAEDDSDPQERALGIRAGIAWGQKADLVAVYTDLGITEGMKKGIAAWKNRGILIEYRTLPTLMWLQFRGGFIKLKEDSWAGKFWNWYRGLDWRDLFGW